MTTTTLNNPAQWLLDWANNGSVSKAGININADTAVQCSTVYSCARVISEAIAVMPLCLYERYKQDGANADKKAEDHYLYDILHKTPSELLTAYAFKDLMITNLLLYGNAIAVIDGYPNKVKGLDVVPPWCVTVLKSKKRKTLVYEIQESDIHFVEKGRYHAEQVIHVTGFTFDGLTGASVVGILKNAIGLALAAEEYGSSYFRNGSRPNGYIKHPAKLTPEARKNLKEDWEQQHRGSINAGRVAVLYEGAEFVPTEGNPADSQCVDIRKLQVVEIARMFKVPLHLLGDMSQAKYSNLELLNAILVIHCLVPICTKIEAELNRKLLSRKEQSSYFFKFIVDGLLRGDAVSRSNALQTQFQHGVISPNEWRELEGRPPIKDVGDKYFVSANLVDITNPGSTGNETDGDEGEGGDGDEIHPDESGTSY